MEQVLFLKRIEGQKVCKFQWQQACYRIWWQKIQQIYRSSRELSED